MKEVKNEVCDLIAEIHGGIVDIEGLDSQYLGLHVGNLLGSINKLSDTLLLFEKSRLYVGEEFKWKEKYGWRLVECPKCGMTNECIEDMILPRISATFCCSSCKRAWILSGDTTIKEDKVWKGCE